MILVVPFWAVWSFPPIGHCALVHEVEVAVSSPIERFPMAPRGTSAWGCVLARTEVVEEVGFSWVLRSNVGHRATCAFQLNGLAVAR